MIDADKLLNDLYGSDKVKQKSAVSSAKSLSVSDFSGLVEEARKRQGGIQNLFIVLSGVDKPVVDTSLTIPAMVRSKVVKVPIKLEQTAAEKLALLLGGRLGDINSCGRHKARTFIINGHNICLGCLNELFVSTR